MAQRVYDIFEKFQDGGEVWRGVGAGLDDLRTKLDQLSQESQNAFFAMRRRAVKRPERCDLVRYSPPVR